jgi:hypothetical protein
MGAAATLFRRSSRGLSTTAHLVAASPDRGLLGEQVMAIGPLSLEYLDRADTRQQSRDRSV